MRQAAVVTGSVKGAVTCGRRRAIAFGALLAAVRVADRRGVREIGKRPAVLEQVDPRRRPAREREQRLALVGHERAEVHELDDVRPSCGRDGDDHAPVGMAADDERTARVVEHAGDRSRVGGQIRRLGRARPHARQVDGEHPHATVLEQGHDPFPGPAAAPGPVDEDDRRPFFPHGRPA